MSKFVINKQTSVGNVILDEQHQCFFSLIEALSDTSESNLSDIVFELTRYINYHFETEEELLSAVNYPYLKEHKARHNYFVIQVARMLGELHANALSIEEVKTTLTDWYLNHIMEEDHKYKDFIINY